MPLVGVVPKEVCELINFPFIGSSLSNPGSLVEGVQVVLCREVVLVLSAVEEGQGGGPLDAFMLGHGVQQLWARYLEEDNITTKIRSGQVEIEIRMAIPTF